MMKIPAASTEYLIFLTFQAISFPTSIFSSNSKTKLATAQCNLAGILNLVIYEIEMIEYSYDISK